MTRSAQPTPGARDDALRRLRRLTVGAAGTALGAVAVFAALGAGTIPGHSGTTSQAATASTSLQSTATTSSSSSSSLQTTSTPQATSSGSAHTVSGGS